MASDYNPVQTVAPNLSSGDNALNVRASPEAFGAQIGQAFQGLGRGLGNIGDQQAQIGIQRQGIMNETYATDAETEGNNQFGDINAEYRNKKGVAAVDAYDETIKKIKDVRQNILKTIPNAAAQRAFNTLFARQEGFMLRDAGLYKAEQEKFAAQHSATASQQQSIDQASDIRIALDDEQFGSLIANVKFQTARLVGTAEFGPDTKKIGMQQDPKTGDVTFDTSNPLGKQASEIYQEYLDKALGQVWTNRIEAIAFDPEMGDVKQAVKLLEDHEKDMPALTVSKLKKELDGPYRSEVTRGSADDILRSVHQDFVRSVTTVKPLAPPPGTKTGAEFKGSPYAPPDSSKTVNIPDLTNSFIEQERDKTGKDLNLGQIQPGTWKDFANPGEDINNPSDNHAVTQRILEKYNRDYHGDLSRIAVAYFSGTKNVSGYGSETPWKEDKKDINGKTTSSYVSDILQRMGGKAVTGTAVATDERPVPASSEGEYYDEHYGEIMKKVDAYADAHGFDNRQRDELESRVSQNINRVIKAETAEKTEASNAVRRFVFGEDGKDIISTIGELENGPPDIQKKWRTMQQFDPNGAQALKTKVLTANSKGRQTTFGTQFWERFEDLVEGRVKNVNDLYKYVGPDKNSPLTNTGLSMLMKEYGIGTNQYGVADPAGQAFLHSELEYFRQLRIDIVGGRNTHNANGERIFQQAVMQALPKIQAARANGAGGEMFDKDSKDYPGGASSYDGRTLARQIDDSVRIQSDTGMSSFLPPEKLRPDQHSSMNLQQFDNVTDVGTGQALVRTFIHERSLKGEDLTPAEYKELKEYLQKRNWIAPEQQDVPVPR